MTPLATQPSRVFTDREAGIRVEWYWIEEHADLLTDAELVLSHDELTRAQRYHFVEDRTSYVLSHVLLRIVVAERLSLAPARIRLEAGVNGKPRLPDSGELCFNMARSNKAVVIALGERIQVGVDIERRDATAIHPGIVGWVLSQTEYAPWQKLADDEQTTAFFAAWTRKEALLKGTGEGLNTPMSSVDALVFDAADNLAAGPVTVVRGSHEWTIADLFDDPEYAVALAYPALPRPAPVQR